MKEEKAIGILEESSKKVQNQFENHIKEKHPGIFDWIQKIQIVNQKPELRNNIKLLDKES